MRFCFECRADLALTPLEGGKTVNTQAHSEKAIRQVATVEALCFFIAFSSAYLETYLKLVCWRSSITKLTD